MKYKSNRTLYFDYNSGEVTDESPKQRYGTDCKLHEDYEFARVNTIFEVDDGEEDNSIIASCSKFYIVFENITDLEATNWLEKMEDRQMKSKKVECKRPFRDRFETFHCPKCHTEIDASWPFGYKMKRIILNNSFCRKCGQKLDWSVAK